MANSNKIDIRENILRSKGRVLDILLSDMTTHKNIIWATDSYTKFDKEYKPKKQILKVQITGLNGRRIQPRASKSREEQVIRTRDKAEVFTPLDIVNKMNASVDDTIKKNNKYSWQDYIKLIWLEISCGEAPFITSRYDPTLNDQEIKELNKRVGFLDKKLQLINKHTNNEKDWFYHAEIALKSCYGYEWQGDNLLIARENILMTTNDFFKHKFGRNLKVEQLENFAEIISCNIFQMDGLKYVIPMSCRKTKPKENAQPKLIDVMPLEETKEPQAECPGCKLNDPHAHTGTYVKVMDWQNNKRIKFVDILKSNRLI